MHRPLFRKPHISADFRRFRTAEDISAESSFIKKKLLKSANYPGHAGPRGKSIKSSAHIGPRGTFAVNSVDGHLRQSVITGSSKNVADVFGICETFLVNIVYPHLQ